MLGVFFSVYNPEFGKIIGRKPEKKKKILMIVKTLENIWIHDG